MYKSCHPLHRCQKMTLAYPKSSASASRTPFFFAANSFENLSLSLSLPLAIFLSLPLRLSLYVSPSPSPSLPLSLSLSLSRRQAGAHVSVGDACKNLRDFDCAKVNLKSGIGRLGLSIRVGVATITLKRLTQS